MTGGSGLLGSEVKKLDTALIAPTQQEMDITDATAVRAMLKKHHPDVVLHLAAATKPPEHEKNPAIGVQHNIMGTAHMALACIELGIKLVYTSTDYIYVGKGPHKEDEPVSAPNNFYLSKLGGECAVRLVPDHLILRLSFGPIPYPWEKVYDDQYNCKLYVNEMAVVVLAAAKSKATGIMNIGGPRTSLANYARRTRPDIQIIPRPAWVPQDTSLDLTKMKQYIK